MLNANVKELLRITRIAEGLFFVFLNWRRRAFFCQQFGWLIRVCREGQGLLDPASALGTGGKTGDTGGKLFQ